jgi:hypothetical protein
VHLPLNHLGFTSFEVPADFVKAFHEEGVGSVDCFGLCLSASEPVIEAAVLVVEDCAGERIRKGLMCQVVALL